MKDFAQKLPDLEEGKKKKKGQSEEEENGKKRREDFEKIEKQVGGRKSKRVRR